MSAIEPAGRTAIATSVAGVPGVDPAAVRRWMVASGLRPTGELTLERVGLGQSNLTYRIRDAAGGTWVLRRPPLGQLLESAHDVTREARILSALEQTQVPVPRVHGALPPGEVGGDVPAFLMSFVDGVVVDRMAVAETMPAHRRRAVAFSLARTLATVHAVDLDETGLTGSPATSHTPRDSSSDGPNSGGAPRPESCQRSTR